MPKSTGSGRFFGKLRPQNADRVECSDIMLYFSKFGAIINCYQSNYRLSSIRSAA